MLEKCSLCSNFQEVRQIDNRIPEPQKSHRSGAASATTFFLAVPRFNLLGGETSVACVDDAGCSKTSTSVDQEALCTNLSPIQGTYHLSNKLSFLASA